MKNLAHEVLEVAVVLAVSAWLVAWAWRLLLPVLPFIGVGVAVVAVARLIIARRNGW